jgi:hypothetical protein
MPAMLKDSRFWWGAAAGFLVGPFVAKQVKMQLDRIKAKAA